ncbi:MAG: PIN domain-containing protein [Nitrospirae bacterium]|nr:PIN domain-containing protein [Nitrospirota bacterium]MCL5061967.1 PIN domain-containing protein [Nitrospirota bacterium]MDA8214137.1 PIN domain-containing protein [Nitrospiraceae bacterium]MDA8338012.1 PIN domain-containing protein [Nitrospiraceae bacterium]
MIAIDTGPIVALFDKNDDKHSLCLNIFKKIQEPLITTWPVLTEVFYLLSFSSNVQDDLWEFIERGVVSIYAIDKDLMKTCRRLMKKYHDLPMDLADATLVAVAEAENISTIFTLDHKDFRIYKKEQGKHFRLLPEKL